MQIQLGCGCDLSVATGTVRLNLLRDGLAKECPAGRVAFAFQALSSRVASLSAKRREKTTYGSAAPPTLAAGPTRTRPSLASRIMCD